MANTFKQVGITSAFSKYCTLDCQLWSHMACSLHVCCRKPGFPLSAVTPLRILSMKSTNRDLYNKILAMEDNLHKLEGKSSWTQHLDTVVQVLYCTVLYCTVLYCTGHRGAAHPRPRPRGCGRDRGQEDCRDPADQQFRDSEWRPADDLLWHHRSVPRAQPDEPRLRGQHQGRARPR